MSRRRLSYIDRRNPYYVDYNAMKEGAVELEIPYTLYGFDRSSLSRDSADTTTPASDDDELPFRKRLRDRRVPSPAARAVRPQL